jgi:hypothetical protein
MNIARHPRNFRLSPRWRHSALLCLLVAGCAVPVTGVVRLSDGLMRAPTEPEAEAFCHAKGAPTRLVKQPKDAEGVLFRCD